MAELDLSIIIQSDRPQEELVQEAKERVSQFLVAVAQFNCALKNVDREWEELTADDEQPNQSEGESDLKDALIILARAFFETSDKESTFTKQRDEQTGEDIFSLADEAETELAALIDEFHGNRTISTGETDKDIAIRLAGEFIKRKSELPVLRINHRIADVSLKQLEYALTLNPNPRAFIAPLGTNVLDRFKIDPSTKQVVRLSDGQPLTIKESAHIMLNAAKTADHSEYDFPLLGFFLEYIKSNPHMVHGNEFDIPYPRIADPLRVDSSHVRRLEELLKSLDPYYGIIFDSNSTFQGVFSVLKISKSDDVNKTLTLSSPYLVKLLEVVKEQNKLNSLEKKKQITGDGLNRLIHSEIHKERNWTAIETAFRMAALLLQNPNRKRMKNGRWEKYVYSRSCFITIGKNTDLQKRLDNIKDVREKTRIIRSTFDKAFEFLKVYSDVFDYFVGLEIYTMDSGRSKHFLDIESLGKEKPKGKYAGISPTYAEYEAGSVLYFRHKGVNPKWAHERD